MKQIAKMNEAVGMKNRFTMDGGGKWLVRPFKSQELWKWRRRMSKELVRCVQSVVGNKKLLFHFEDGQKKYISSSLLVFLSSKEEVEMDEAISYSPEKEQGELLTIFGDAEVG